MSDKHILTDCLECGAENKVHKMRAAHGAVPMKVVCDTCGRTATGLMDDLIDAGWRRVVVSSPIRKTFTGCPDHARLVSKAAVDAVEEAIA